jgi:hypothetical protein
LGTSEEIIGATELLFFDVRPLRTASDWIACRVLMGESTDQEGLITRMRAAFFGGPLVAKDILDAEPQHPLSDADKIFQRGLRLHLKFNEALAMPLTGERSALRYLQMYLDYDYKTARLKMAEQRFRHRCEEDLRKHELSERRIAVQLQRHEQEAAARKRKAAERARLDWVRAQQSEAFARQRHLAAVAEQQAAERRAASSPLAALTWSGGEGRPSQTILAGAVARQSAMAPKAGQLPVAA